MTRASGVAFRYETDLRRGRSLATLGGGAAAADLDGDGLPEIYFTGSVRNGRHPERGPAGILYRNRGDGTFEDRTVAAGVRSTGWGMSAHFADLEGTGRPDLLLEGMNGLRLFRNRGSGTFEAVSGAAGLAAGRWPLGAAFLDANGDGRLDVYIGNYLDTDYAKEQTLPLFQIRTPDDYAGLPNALFLQRPDGTFVDATAGSGTSAPGSKTLGACALDYDGDGIDDLFVANDRTPNLLFRGRGDGTFEDATLESGIAEISGRTGPRAGMGIAVGDPDGDGRPDLVVTNFSGEPVTFYRNMGGGIFEDAAEEAGLVPGTLPYVQWGAALEDLDNDGRPDLAVVSGHLVPRVLSMMAKLFRRGGAGPYGRGSSAFRQPAVLYRGLGDGRFEDVTRASGDFARMRVSARGSACADLDGDGLLDLVVAAVSGGVRILKNVTPNPGAAIEILPEPVAGAADAGEPTAPGAPAGDSGAGEPRWRTVVGTRIAVTAGGRRQVREFGVVPSYASGSWLPLHFGVGDAATVDTIEVFPPGVRTPSAIYRDVAAGGLYATGPSGIRLIRPFRRSRTPEKTRQ